MYITARNSDGRTTTQRLSLQVINVANESPTRVEILNATATILEDVDTTNRVKVADIRIYDQGNGTNTLTLLG